MPFQTHLFSIGKSIFLSFICLALFVFAVWTRAPILMFVSILLLYFSTIANASLKRAMERCAHYSIRRGRCPHRPVFQCNDHMDAVGHDDIFISVSILMLCIDIIDVLLGDCPNFTQKNRRGYVGIALYGPQNVHGAMWASSPYGAHTLNWNLSFLCLKIAMNKMFISFASMTVLDQTMFLCHLA